MIEFRRVSKWFGPHQVLCEIDTLAAVVDDTKRARVMLMGGA